MKFSRLSISLALFVLPLVTGCQPQARVTTPEGFAELEPDDHYGFRATSAAGVVIGVRTEKNEPRGSLDFWTAAVDYRVRKLGYSTEGGAPTKVTSKGGLEGRRLRYALERQGRPHEYWVTVFVAEDSVYVVEAAGDRAYFDDAVQARIEQATRTIDPG